MATLSLLLAATLHAAPAAPAAPTWTVSPSPDPPVAASQGQAGPGLRYNNVDGAFVLGDFYGLRGAVSFDLDGPWIGLGRLEYLTGDEGNVEVDEFVLSGGAGYVLGLGDSLDLIGSAELEWAHIELENAGSCADDDDIGLRLRGGLRYQANEEIELAGGLSYSTRSDEDFGVDFQVLYAFDERFSCFTGIDIRDDTFATVGLRYSF